MIEGAPFIPLAIPPKTILWVGGAALGVALNDADADGVEALCPNMGVEAWPFDALKGFDTDCPLPPKVKLKPPLEFSFSKLEATGPGPEPLLPKLKPVFV